MTVGFGYLSARCSDSLGTRGMEPRPVTVSCDSDRAGPIEKAYTRPTRCLCRIRGSSVYRQRASGRGLEGFR